MPGTSDVIYLYDGSFEGLLCCVHESVYTHELPVDIQPEEAAQPTLFRQKYIAADEEKAARVYDSIPRKISPDAAALVQCVFLSCMPGKELAILRFLLLGYRRGRQTMYLLSHTAVQPMLAARQNLLNEAHLLKEFLRFSDYDGALAATITPKNYVLPFLKEHFCSRLKNETFLIFDRTHKAALVWQDRKARIISLDTLELPPATAEELRYRVPKDTGKTCWRWRMSCGARRTVWMPCRPPRPPCSHKRRDIMEPNIPSPVCRKDGVEIHAAVPKDITEAFSVIAVRENGAWLLVRHSARKTWELPGGHREPDETPLEAACRELYEETGALRFRLCACGCYSVTQGGQTSWGALFLAEAITRGPLPESEIAQVRAFAALPSALTYPTIQPVLHACAEKYLRGGALENAPLFRAPVRKGERP